MSQFMVIGLDGMSMPLLELLIRRNLFKEVGKLISSGFLCPLSSTMPPVTGPAWATFATGVNPGKHGVLDFVLPGDTLSTLRPVSSQNIRTKTFYEYLEDQERQAILVNLPLSWPPLTTFPTLTSFMTRSENTVYPPGLVNEIPILRQYRIAPTVRRPNRGEPTKAYIECVRELERIKFQCATQLLGQKAWDFFFVLFGATDWVSHLAYDQLIAGNIPEEIARLYSDLDSYILGLRQSAPDDTNIIIMSDHGFRVTRVQFTINAWLAQEGYLVKQVRGEESRQKHALAAGDPANAVNLTHLARLANIPVVKSLAVRGYQLLRQIIRRFGRDFHFDVSFDPQRTLAACVSHESDAIYINRANRYQDGTVDAERYEALRSELIAKLSQITDPQTGERVFKRVRRSEEVYDGEALSCAPDIVFELNDNYKLGLSYVRPNLFDRTIVNDHSSVGILAGFGPVFRPDAQCTNASLMDLAPTILHCMDLPVPDSYDGMVLRDVLDPGSAPYKTPVSYCKSDRTSDRTISSDSDEALVLERLRGLGYID